MSITDFRTARREDQESSARQAREAEALKAQLEREAKQQAFEQELARKAQLQAEKDAEAARVRMDREAKGAAELAKKQAELAAKSQADKERRRERARRRKERREQFAARVNAAPKWLAEHLDLAAALAVMVCSIAPALMSQAASLKATGLVVSMGLLGWLLVALLPVMLECSAWAATAGEAKAMKEQRSPWPYRIAVYVFAGLAAWINYLHGSHVGGDEYGVILGSVLAASSVIPIMVWQLVQLGRHRVYRQQMKAGRQVRKDEQRTKRDRKKQLPEVWATAGKLRAIAGRGRLSSEDAWQAAWAVHEGAGADVLADDLLALLSADLLGLRVEAEESLAVVLEDLKIARAWRMRASGRLSMEGVELVSGGSTEASTAGGATLPTQVPQASVTALVDATGKPLLRTVSPQITPSIPPSARTSESAPARTRVTAPVHTRRGSAKGGSRRLSEGARRAASNTAKKANPDENKAIEQWIVDELKGGREPSKGDVEKETLLRRSDVSKKPEVPSRSWCYARIKNAKKSLGLHRVDDHRRSA